jgi:hypothetical protein
MAAGSQPDGPLPADRVRSVVRLTVQAFGKQERNRNAESLPALLGPVCGTSESFENQFT